MRVSLELVEHRNSYSLSMLLHLSVVLFAAFGLPHVLPKKPDPAPVVLSVEILPITGVTNVKPSEEPIQKEQKSHAPVNTKPIPPTAKEPPKPVTPEKSKAEPTPIEAAPNTKATPKPKDEPKKTTHEKKKPDDFAALLSKLQQESKPDPSKTAKDTTTTTENKTKSEAPYDPSVPLGLSEIDAIRSQFVPCWRMPIGAKDPQSLAAMVHLTLQADGTVLTAELVPEQQGRYAADPFFRAAADAAIAATHKCSPLKNLPPDKYNSWREFNLNFNPAEMM